MSRVIRWLLFGDSHKHKFTVLKEAVSAMGHYYTKFYSRCETCGKIKVTYP